MNSLYMWVYKGNHKLQATKDRQNDLDQMAKDFELYAYVYGPNEKTTFDEFYENLITYITIVIEESSREKIYDALKLGLFTPNLELKDKPSDKSLLFTNDLMSGASINPILKHITSQRIAKKRMI